MDGAAERMMHQRNHAFTLIEMCIGMAITAMIGGAVATFSLAVSQNWQNEQHNLRLSLGADVIAERLRSRIQASVLLGGCKSGALSSTTTSAGILLWVNDSNGDGNVQGNETALIYFDPSTQQLRLYEGTPSETATWSYANAFVPTASVEAYRNGRSSTLLANNIVACSFTTAGNSVDGTSSVGFAFQQSVANGNKTQSIVHYGWAALRAAAAIPSN